MMNKKEKRQTATIIIILTLLALLVMGNPDTSRKGFGEDFNEWYSNNTTLVVIVALGIVLMMVFWGFHESKMEKETKYRRAVAQQLREQRKFR